MDTGETEQTAHRQDQETRDAQQTHTLVDALTRGQRRRIDELDVKFEGMIGDHDTGVIGSLDRVATRLDFIDGRLVGADERLDQFEERLTARIESLERSLADVVSRLTTEPS